jgi:quinohemoprotein amine dehydrogenase
VESEALPGQRDVVVGGIVSRGALAVFDRIDYVRVLPEQGMARLGGGAMPKQFQQFDAVAYHEGPDGVTGTEDDIELGPVPVSWSVEEFNARLNDDDILYVGTLGPNGLFTPNIDGPNPERKGQTNNYGDVRVIATYEGEGTDKPIRGGAHLVVTVPLYVRWLQLEVLP